MEVLFGLFQTVESFGEIVGRADQKSQELKSLITHMESIAASVKSFTQDLTQEEREEAYHSNKVFPELVHQMKLCDGVISKRYEAIEAAAAQARAVSAPSRVSTIQVLDSAFSNLKKGILSCGRESLETISGKLGTFSSLLRLPEDELAVIRDASTELHKMVPLLALAITAHSSRGNKKRSCDSLDELSAKRSCPALQDRSASATSSYLRPRSPERETEKANFLLQLVSDAAVARSCKLPVLTTSDLRNASAAGAATPPAPPATSSTAASTPFCNQASTTSFDSAVGSDSGGSTPRKLFGRMELYERVPKEFQLPVQGGARLSQQHVSRFVSRDLFWLEETPAVSQSPGRGPQMTLDMPTLEFGAADDSGTLPLGGFAETSASAVRTSLATAAGLGKAGLHCRSVGETVWRWVAQDTATELHCGDRIALLLESPPGSITPAPQRDLQADEVTCLLGVEFCR